MWRISSSTVTAALWLVTAPAFGAWVADPNDWSEANTPPPPAFQASRALPFDMPLYSSLVYAVDPATLVIGADGVVRYVLVITSPDGTVTALYEGLRCVTAEFKTYARYNAGQWSPVSNAQWLPMVGTQQRHALALAKQGVCTNAAPATSVGEMVKALKSGQRGY